MLYLKNMSSKKIFCFFYFLSQTRDFHIPEELFIFKTEKSRLCCFCGNERFNDYNVSALLCKLCYQPKRKDYQENLTFTNENKK